MLRTDVVVIGGGAAGLFCGITAGKRGRKVVVLEHADRIGKKIAISGGGRCNFTNLNTSADNFISDNPHFCKSALARYTSAQFVSLVEKHGIAYHEKKLGQLFCDGTSRQIIEMLLTEASEADVAVRCDSLVRVVRSVPLADRGPRQGSPAGVVVAGGSSLGSGLFEIETNSGTITSQSLVVATGGLSIPPLGATDLGYRLARQFGLAIVEPRPALVPFTLPPQAQRELAPVSGISIDASVSCRGKQFRENILITHRGLSGPAMLQISSYWLPGDRITINLLPDYDAQKLLREHENKEITLANFLGQFLPRRFVTAWCAVNFPSLTGTAGVRGPQTGSPAGVLDSPASSNKFTQVRVERNTPDNVAFNESGRDARGPSTQPIKQYTPRQLADIARKLNHWEIIPSGTEGYKKAEVTAGGVSTAELSSQTMETRSVAGLYFIGEVVDVTGQLGGYNFQWAWASGYAAGQSV